MGTLRRQYDLMIQLMLDEELRERFFTERDEVVRELGLEEEDLAVFASVDRHGLEVDARVRRDYIMSALCRSYPLTTAAIGASASGRRALTAFLSSPSIRAPLGARTATFGDHLERLLSFQSVPLGPPAIVLLQSVLTLERARVDVAGAVRTAVDQHGPSAAPELPSKPTASQLKRGKLALPPFLVAQELKTPLAVLQTALNNVGPENAWSLIQSGALASGRFDAVARALPMPVTVLSRAIVRGMATERAGAGAGAPLVDVRHVVAELSGHQRSWLEGFNGTKALAELPPADFRVARQLAEQGLLELRFD